LLGNYSEQGVGSHHPKNHYREVVLYSLLLLFLPYQPYIKQRGQQDHDRGRTDGSHDVEDRLDVLDPHGNSNNYSVNSCCVEDEVKLSPFFPIGLELRLDVGANLFHLVPPAPVLMLDLLVLEEDQLGEGDEIVPAAEEHDGKGKKDGGEESKVNHEVEPGTQLLVDERLQEVGLRMFPHVIVAKDSHQHIGDDAEGNAYQRGRGHLPVCHVLHPLENREEVHLIVESQKQVRNCSQPSEPVVRKALHVAYWVVGWIVVQSGRNEKDHERYHEETDPDNSAQGHELEFLHFGDEGEGNLHQCQEQHQEPLLGEEHVEDIGLTEGVLEYFPDGSLEDDHLCDAYMS
jgi:hypothetical protein